MKKFQKKIQINKIDENIKMKKLNPINNKTIKTNLTKKNTHEFMKLTINDNSTLFSFQNLFNKTFNNINDNSEMKKENKISNKNTISSIKKNSYKVIIGKK